MRDWKRYVRARLSLASVGDDRQERIVQELAGQIEEFYLEALAEGASEEESLHQAESRIGDWDSLSADIGRAEQPAMFRRAGQRILRFEGGRHSQGRVGRSWLNSGKTGVNTLLQSII